MGYLTDPNQSYTERTEEGQMSDETVLSASINNPSLFGLIVDRYEEAFLRKARSILGQQRVEVEDVVQETFTKIYLNANRFRVQEGATFKSWAYRILINTTFTYYQKLKKKDNFFAQLDDEIWAILPDLKGATIERDSTRDMVASVLSRMPTQLARVLKMHFIDDLPQKQIAEREGLSVPAVKTRIHRAKKEFKKFTRVLNPPEVT